ncbi:hypothetical protein [Limosilactobacillus kribbianus]|uniref:hypothetical protein n=1 Tax=Limosilactobacillus kribbianus TaxID=2982695 RepID=UPI00226460CE|nr:hypothetical protein [Limosilactobacillus kribbianus]
MDENLKSMIASTKAIIRDTEEQLEMLKKDPHPDQQLLKVTQNNHDKAVQILQQINGAPVSTQDVGPRTVTDARPINVNHDLEHGFQIIPPASEHVASEQKKVSVTTNKQPAQSSQPAHRTVSTATTSSSSVKMTRAQYRAMLK